MTADHRLQTAPFVPPSGTTKKSVVPSSVVSLPRRSRAEAGSLACERKPDPYATKAHRAIDVLLILFTALLLFVVFRTSPLAHRNAQQSGDTTKQAQATAK